jgi:type I restriction enzyme S subunit
MRSVTSQERKGRVLQRGDLLLEKSGGGEIQPVGFVVLYDNEESAICSNFVSRLTPSDVADFGYFLYVHAAIYAIGLNKTAINQTTGIQNLDSDAYFNIVAPFPPLSEQRAIAAFLDRKTAEIDAVIVRKERLIALLQEERQALISRAVTRGLDAGAVMKDSGIPWLGEVPKHWAVRKLGTFATVGNGSTPLRDNWSYWDSGDFPWLNSSVVNDEVVGQPSRHVTRLALRECHLPVVEPGSVLIAITGEGKTRGKASILNYKATISQHLAYIKPDEAVATSRFVRYFLDSMYEVLRDLSDGAGSTKGAITCEQLRNLRICLPPLIEQEEILRGLDAATARIDRLVTLNSDQISKLREYRQALISAAVTGKLALPQEVAT